MRIACFLPGITQLLYHLDLGDSLVARLAGPCWPAAAAGAPVLAQARAGAAPPGPATGNSSVTGAPSLAQPRTGSAVRAGEAGGSDAADSAHLAGPAGWLLGDVPPHRHLSPISIDIPALVAQAPDIVIVDERCPVCLEHFDPVLSGGGSVLQVATHLTGRPIRVVSIQTHRLDDSLVQITGLAEVLGVAEAGESVRKRREARLLALRMHVARYLVSSRATRPTVLLLEGLSSRRAAGGWRRDVLDAAGGIPLVSDPGTMWPPLTVEALTTAAPEVLIVGVHGQTAAAGALAITEMISQPSLGQVPAMRSGRVWAVDFEQLLAHPGPRLVETVEVFLRMILPQALGANGTPPDAALAVCLGRMEP